MEGKCEGGEGWISEGKRGRVSGFHWLSLTSLLVGLFCFDGRRARRQPRCQFRDDDRGFVSVDMHIHYCNVPN